MKLQIAFQGGGARLAVLLAAAEAVQELEHRKIIEVTRVAGTSAGAIVAALFAARCNIADIRVKLAGPEGQRLLTSFPPIGTVKSLYKAWRGDPLWDDAPLARWLTEQFAAAPNSPRFIKDLPTCLLVMSTDLESAHGSMHSAEEDLVTALLTSAGLPFCFRTWKSSGQTVKVDGGLCENLPVNDLIAAEQTDGRVVAFSFHDARPGRPKNLFRFGMSLFDAAISHSVQSARNRLGAGAVCVLKPKNPIFTFSFPQAREFLASEDYSTVKQSVVRWFERLRVRSDVATPAQGHFTQDVWCKPKTDDIHRQMERVGKVYRQQHLGEKFHYRSVKLLATANCLAPFTHPGAGKPDEVFYELGFQVAATPLFAHRLTLSSTQGNDFFGNYAVELFDSAGNPLPFELLASIAPESGKDRELIAYFLPPLSPQSGPYRLSMRDQGEDLLKGLTTAQHEDGFGIGLSRACGPIDSIQFGLHVPIDFSVMELRRTNLAGVKPVPLSNGELLAAFGPTPLGYRTYGWGLKNLQPCDYLEVMFGT
jgi:predicted acylesterase/phospholipase RssA